MKAVIQRVASAQVTVDGIVTGAIQQGLMILLGVAAEDTRQQAALLAHKIANFRIFTDENDKMNLSLLDVQGQALVVSNFTLCADVSHGRRPSFINAMKPQEAEIVYEQFVDLLREQGIKKVETGRFGADMQISLINDGPVTLTVNTDEWK